MDPSILRTAREQRRLSRADVANATSLSPRVVAAIDDGQLHRLPAGIYARSFVRAYAEAVGLDAEAIASLVNALPRPDVTLPAVVAARQQAFEPLQGDPATRRRAAAFVDLAIVAIISGAEVLACFLIAGVGPPDFATAFLAGVALAAPTLAAYFALLGATGVGTIGSGLFQVEFVPRLEGPVDGTALLQRTLEYLRGEIIALLNGSVEVEA